MTVRLLVPAYGKQTNALYTGTTATERALIDAGQADNSLDASFDYPAFLAGKSMAPAPVLGQASVDAASASGVDFSKRARLNPGNIGMRSNPAGLLSEYGNVGAYTWQTLIALPQDADEIQIGFVNGLNAAGTTGSPNFTAAAAVVSDTTTAPAASSAFNALLFGGSNTGVLATAAATTVPSQTRRKKVTWSDWLTISTIPRTDGGALPLVSVRIALTTVSGAPLTILGGGNVAPYNTIPNWATHADGRIWDQKFAGGSRLGDTFAAYAAISGTAYQPDRLD
jgi:hypothetical protein